MEVRWKIALYMDHFLQWRKNIFERSIHLNGILNLQYLSTRVFLPGADDGITNFFRKLSCAVIHILEIHYRPIVQNKIVSTSVHSDVFR